VGLSSVDNRPCVALGEETLVLFAEWSQNAAVWRFRLFDLRSPPIRASSWVTIPLPDNLIDHRRAAPIREEVGAEWENWRTIINWAIMVFQDNAMNFIVEEVPTEAATTEEPTPDEPVPLTDDEENEVIEILSTPGGALLLKLHLDNLIAGEDDNKVLTFVLLLSGKSNDFKMKQMILFSGASGAGKSTLMTIADLFHTKDVGRFTKRALDWSNLAGYEVLRLKEFGMMDSEDEGTSTIKFLSADDQGYIVEATIRDEETKKLVTEEKRIDPITVISSTTRAQVGSQYARRNWPISPDESEEQTERVRLWLIRDEEENDEVNLGFRRETSCTRSKRILSAVVQRLEMCDCIIPFTSTLTGILRAVDIPNRSVRLRVRGDYKKLLTLIKLYGIFQQNLLPPVDQPEGRVVFMLPENALEILRVAIAPLTTMLTGADRKTNELLDAMERFIDFGGQGTYPINKELRDTIGNSLGNASHTIRLHFNRLERLGHLGSEMSGREKIFKLGTTVASIRSKLSVITSIMENEALLIAQMYEEGLERLNRLCDNNPVGGVPVYMSQIERVRDIFARYTPMPPGDMDTHRSLSDSNALIQEPRVLTPRIDDGRNYCYHCLEDITEKAQFDAEVDGHPVKICEDCHNPQAAPLLSERLDMILHCMHNLRQATEGEPMTIELITERVNEEHPDANWTGGLVTQIMATLERDGSIFQPRPGYWQVTS